MCKVENSPLVSELASICFGLYSNSSFTRRIIQTLRPFICPLDKIIHNVPANSDVLDIGCGAGSLIGLLAKLNLIRSGTGLDIDEKAIADASKMSVYLDKRCEIEFFYEELQQFAQKGKMFSTVLMVDVLHHVTPSKQIDFINLAQSFVQPNGILIFKDMCQKPAWKAFMNRIHDLIMAKQWIHYFPIQGVIYYLTQKGFQVINREDYSNFWYGHEMCVFKRISK